MASLSATEALARSLLVASSEAQAVRGFVTSLAPPADLVAWISPADRRARVCFRKEAGAWQPLALPPVELTDWPAAPLTRRLPGGRRAAFDDLVCSLGLDQLLVLPLAAGDAGALLLARNGAPFGEDEPSEWADHSELLALALAGLAQRRRSTSESAPSREVLGLFELTRRLASAVSTELALQAGAACLIDLLAPPRGALICRSGPGTEGIALAWPEEEGGHEALDRALDASSPETLRTHFLAAPRSATLLGRDWHWLVLGSPEQPVTLALGWQEPPSPEAQRVGQAVSATLSLALERLQAQQSREERRLNTAVDGLPLGIVLLGSTGRVRLANGVGRRLLSSIDAWPGIGGTLRRIGSLDPLARARQAGGGAETAAEVFDPVAGRTLVARCFSADAQHGSEEPDIVVVLEDVTEARRQKRQLVQAEKLSALGVLISGIVHEINNPLSTILGYAQMLAATPQPKPKDRWLKTLQEEARRCQRIVRDMLDVARPRESSLQSLEVVGIAEKALSLVAHPFRTASIEATLHADPGTPPVKADPDALLRLFLNLLTNALHALEGQKGTRRVEVAVKAAAGGEMAEIIVRDNGPGIPPEHLHRICDPFFTTKPEGKGSGLGLSLVEATVREHGGQVDVESSPGAGATFRIVLPAQHRTRAAAPAADDKPAKLAVALRGVRVLVADDEPAVAGLLAEVLEQAGARTSVVMDGLAALQVVLADPPDAIVCDLNMPQLRGDELLAELRDRAPQIASRIIFSTGDLQAASGAARFERHGRPCLAKPFDLQVVIQTVRELAARPQPVRGGMSPPGRSAPRGPFRPL
jgi:signal transduction histidine kinase/ActR/RegA family two-component response regulator